MNQDPNAPQDPERAQAFELLRIIHAAWHNQPEMVCITDEFWNIITCNNTFLRDTEWNPDQVIGRRFIDFIETDELPENWQLPVFPPQLAEGQLSAFPALLAPIRCTNDELLPGDVRIVCIHCGADTPALQGRRLIVATIRDAEGLQPAIFDLMGQLPEDAQAMIQNLQQQMMGGGGPMPGMPPGMMPPGMMPPGMVPPPGHPGGHPGQHPGH